LFLYLQMYALKIENSMITEPYPDRSYIYIMKARNVKTLGGEHTLKAGLSEMPKHNPALITIVIMLWS